MVQSSWWMLICFQYIDGVSTNGAWLRIWLTWIWSTMREHQTETWSVGHFEHQRSNSSSNSPNLTHPQHQAVGCWAFIQLNQLTSLPRLPSETGYHANSAARCRNSWPDSCRLQLRGHAYNFASGHKQTQKKITGISDFKEDLSFTPWGSFSKGHQTSSRDHQAKCI